ncbi:MAG: type II toxin-antitoxin system VapC family toxin [Cyclobacteriaceae bacterium]|nr:type II toxin-antitoxin system VapC family toxin [Cyclobacteriaceae bacterium]
MRIDFLADTNILINLLEGDKRLLSYTEKLFAVSFISEIELLGMPGITPAQVKISRSLLNACVMIPYSDEIKEIAIELKQKQKITLPDALIAATGIRYNIPVLTFDKGFKKIPGISLLLLE